MKTFWMHEAGLLFTKINIVAYPDKKKTLPNR